MGTQVAVALRPSRRTFGSRSHYRDAADPPVAAQCGVAHRRPGVAWHVSVSVSDMSVSDVSVSDVSVCKGVCQ